MVGVYVYTGRDAEKHLSLPPLTLVWDICIWSLDSGFFWILNVFLLHLKDAQWEPGIWKFQQFQVKYPHCHLFSTPIFRERSSTCRYFNSGFIRTLIVLHHSSFLSGVICHSTNVIPRSCEILEHTADVKSFLYLVRTSYYLGLSNLYKFGTR